MSLFARSANGFVYLAAIVALAAGVAWKTTWPVVSVCLLFFVWDTAYLSSKQHFSGRTIQTIFTDIDAARTQISFFLPFYGVLFGILFTLEPVKQRSFAALLADANVSAALLAVPFVLASVGMLFVPIQASVAHGEERPTRAMSVLFWISSISQKVSILLFLHVALSILLAVAQPRDVVKAIPFVLEIM